MSRLRNSITHLQETQSELRSFLEEDEDEDGEIGLAIDENEITMYVLSFSFLLSSLLFLAVTPPPIFTTSSKSQFRTYEQMKLTNFNRASQRERIQLIIIALTNKVGVDALKHYGLEVDTIKDTNGKVEVDTGPEAGTEVEVEVEDEGGIHL